MHDKVSFSELNPPSKLFSLKHLKQGSGLLKEQDKKIVLTNGCFDLLHVGHLAYLQAARQLGDFLWVGLNSDASIHALKGPSRPILNEFERAYTLSALACVDAIFVFPTLRLTAEILAIKPSIYVKAGDYTLETLNAEERDALQTVGAQIVFMPFIPGYSSTSLIEKIRNLYKK